MTKAYREKLKARVARGVRYLDKTVPDWATRIDLRTLQLESTSMCVLGQCFGDFWTALGDVSLELSFKRAASSGFVIPNGEYKHRGEYEFLGLTWAPYIAVRQMKAWRQKERA